MSAALVVAAVVALAFACVGVVAMRGPLARLHYVTVGALGAVLAAAAIVVESGPSIIGLKAVTLAVFLAVTSPVLAHATARAIHHRQERRR